MYILLITPNFFNYPKAMCKKLEECGHRVDWFDDRPCENGVVKAIIRLRRDLISPYIKQYFESIMSIVCKKKYDLVMVVSGQSLSFSHEMLERIKECQTEAEFVLYQWDSVRNFPYIEKMYDLFDRLYTFDPHDAERNVRLTFLPLFYTDAYKKIRDNTRGEPEFDVSYVGTAHPLKYSQIKEMADQVRVKWPRQFMYHYMPSQLVYFYRKITNDEFKKARYSDFHYKALSQSEMDELITGSGCILDAPQEGQTGLTIRVIEMLGAGKKIITTNKSVLDMDFYRKENIYLYEGSFDYSDPFFCEPYKELPNDLYEKYSLNSWLSVLLGEK